MQARDRDTPLQACAWMLVALLHLGLYWWLTHTGWRPAPYDDAGRMRLRLYSRPSPVTSAPQPAQPVAIARTFKSRHVPQATTATAAESPSPATPALDWQAQAAEWARRQRDGQPPGGGPPGEVPAFATDPLRQRQAKLPGGRNGGQFRVHGPTSPHDVLSAIGGLLNPGYNPDPCPRIRENLAGLLAVHSDRERRQRDEEIRRDRAYCQP